MRPVDNRYGITQNFGEGATAGVAASADPNSGTAYLVYLYGNYQPFGHAGTDIGTPVGTPVRAARSGTAVWVDWDVNLPGDDSWGPSGYFRRWAFYKSFGGRLLVIQHAPNDLDVYAHLSAWKVKAGQFVNEGDLVALSGDSSGGRDGVLGAHLHTERVVDTGSYSTGNGLIYGRMDPTSIWGGIAAQGETIILGGIVSDLSLAEQQEVLAAARKINRYLDAPIGAIPEKVWNQTVIRGGQNVSVKQELADAKTDGQKGNAALAALLAVTKSTAMTPEQVGTAVKDALASNAVTVDVKVNGKVGA